MKLEPRCRAKNNKLYRISDDSEVDLSSFMRIEAAMICGKELEEGARIKMVSELTATRNKVLFVYLPWFLVEAEPEVYNEAVLASLRDFLKEVETSGLQAVVVPQPEADSCPVPLLDNGKISPESADLFIAAMKHAARRIKDCESVIGFAVPKELFVDGIAEDSVVFEYISGLSQKHAQYVFFADKKVLEKNNYLEDIKKTNIVLY